jgi:hypothetical protein
MIKLVRYKPWLAASVVLNLLLAWFAGNQYWASKRESAALRVENSRLEQSVQTLYRALPRNAYTRNEFALAITLPGMIPVIRDCLVQFGDDMFVFDRSHTIIGMYRAGPNPFAPEGKFERGYRCDTRLLEAQMRRTAEGAANWRMRVEPAKAAVRASLEGDDPAWGKR